MTTRVPARHRAPVRPLTPLTGLAETVGRSAGAAGRGVAVVAAAGGLALSVAAPAGAAPAPAAVDASVRTAVSAAFSTSPVGVVAAPATAAAQVATTAAFTAVPTPAPPPPPPAPAVVRAERAASGVAPAAVVPAVAAVPAAAPAPPPAPVVEAAPVVPLGQRILDVASRYAGVPYVYGGSTPAGFDCSGFTSWVMREVGVEIPRTANAQKGAAAPLAREHAVPGDLVFFSNRGGRAYHVGIYAGGNMMWDSPRAGKPVQLRAIWSPAVTFGRVAPV